MTTGRRWRSRRVLKYRPAENPLAPLPDGKVRCHGCGKVLAPTPTGRLRRHNAPSGEPCAYTANHSERVRLAEIPPVVIAPEPKGRAAGVRPPTGPSRLDVGSECRECGKWLPGERSLCGACSTRLERARKR